MDKSHRLDVLITGGQGFTGRHFASFLDSLGYNVSILQANLLDRESLASEIRSVKPDFVVHLGGVSYDDGNINNLYEVNLIGTLNLLSILDKLPYQIRKIILASSASVYGDLHVSHLNESLMPKPLTHYASSKLAMEVMSSNFKSNLNLLILRPFNYTGPYHSKRFIIPKIIDSYIRKASFLEIGNVDVYREFNDIRDICHIYELLFHVDTESGDILNICSGRLVSLLDVINYCDSFFKTEMKLVVNQKYVRRNEIKFLCGDNTKLNSLIDYNWNYSYTDSIDYIVGSIVC